jgi:hypothetical protein
VLESFFCIIIPIKVFVTIFLNLKKSSMAWKEILKRDMSNPEKKSFYRYRSSKIVFVLGAFLFFLNFFFSGANFYPDLFNAILPFTYVSFCMTLYLFVYNFFIFIVFKNKHFVAKFPIMLICI